MPVLLSCRTVGFTALNEQSSRSHMVFTLRIDGVNTNTDIKVRRVAVHTSWTLCYDAGFPKAQTSQSTSIPTPARRPRWKPCKPRSNS